MEFFPPALMKALEWGTLENQKTKKKTFLIFTKFKRRPKPEKESFFPYFYFYEKVLYLYDFY